MEKEMMILKVWELERRVANKLAAQRTKNLTGLREGPEAALLCRIAESKDLETLVTSAGDGAGGAESSGCSDLRVLAVKADASPLPAAPNLRRISFGENRLGLEKRPPGLLAGILRKAGPPGPGEVSYPRGHACTHIPDSFCLRNISAIDHQAFNIISNLNVRHP